MTATSDLAPILTDLELGTESLPVVDLPDPAGDTTAVTAPLQEQDALLGVIPSEMDDRGLATLRDRLWPEAHLTAIYRVAADGRVTRTALAGDVELPERLEGPARTVLFLRSRDAALGRATTVAKFDANAEGWNGVPGTATYGHYRWMRRLLAVVGKPESGQRVLDAGCGAGWVGIEAARLGAMASAFDPSPEMVRISKENAASEGVDLDARVGFVEDVPFDRPFEIVLNSGVISFAPDAGAYLDSLDKLVAPGGVLVIGDLNPLSRGFARRRRRPLLPARELNGLRRLEVAMGLHKRGYEIEDRWYYQLTFPIPETMASSEQRFGGFGCRAALLANKAATAVDHAIGSVFASQFDSWVLRARKRG